MFRVELVGVGEVAGVGVISVSAEGDHVVPLENQIGPGYPVVLGTRSHCHAHGVVQSGRFLFLEELKNLAIFLIESLQLASTVLD